MALLWVVLLLFVALILKYKYSKSTTGLYPTVGPISFLIILFKVPFLPYHEIIDDLYKKYGKIFHLRFLSWRGISISDPYLIEEILIKKFNKFPNRLNVRKTGESFDDLIVFMEHKRWKKSRQAMSPIFTKAKIRKILPQMMDCAKVLIENLTTFAEKEAEVDIHEIYDFYTMDIMSLIVFACRVNSYKDPNNSMVQIVRDFFKTLTPSRIWLAMLFPKLKRFLNLKIVETHVIRYVEAIVSRNANQYLNNTKEDLPDNTDLITLILKHNANETPLMEEELAAHALSFLSAGFHTSSTSLSCVSMLLAENPECQERLLHELDEAINEKGEISMVAIENLEYMSACISETLRLYPAIPLLNRTALQTVNLGDICLEKGTDIIIPIASIHMDEQFYPNPTIFDPNRFLPENISKIKDFTYLPFGTGPRNCIGAQFALLELKLTLATILSKFRFVRSSTHAKTRPEMRCNSSVLHPKKVVLKIEKRLAKSPKLKPV